MGVRVPTPGMLIVAFVLVAMPAGAELPPMACSGDTPDWTLRVGRDEARFDHPLPLDFDIPQYSRAEGRDWPLAATLIEREGRATAILVVEAARCDDGRWRAVVLTQKGTTPVLLSGCCRLGTES